MTSTRNIITAMWDLTGLPESVRLRRDDRGMPAGTLFIRRESGYEAVGMDKWVLPFIARGMLRRGILEVVQA